MKIFVAALPRMGTKYLHRVFKSLTEIPSFHEPQPYGMEIMRDVNTPGELHQGTKKILQDKVKFIRESSLGGNYCETGNMFIKVFVWEIMKQFDDVGCIWVYRNPLEVWRSNVLYSNYHKEGNYNSFLHPCWAKNLCMEKEPLEWHDLVLWNWFEVRRRFFHWSPRFKKSYVLDIDKASSLQEIHKMLRHFEVPFDDTKPLPKDDVAINSLEFRKIKRKPFDELLSEVTWRKKCQKECTLWHF